MAANPLRGETPLVVGDATYTLVLDYNGLCILGDRLDLGIKAIVAKLSQDIRPSFLRAMLWAALQQRHPEVTELEAGALIGEAGHDAVEAAILAAFTNGFPRREDANAPADPLPGAKPAKTGTSRRSSQPGAS